MNSTRARGVMVLIGLAALAGSCSGASPSRRLRAEAYDGSLEPGRTVRAIVLSGSEPFAHSISALRRSQPGAWSGEELYFENRTKFEAGEPTLVVFRVNSMMPVHTRPDASGMVEYIQVAFAELLAVEMTESAAIEKARVCAGLPLAATSDEPEPFTHGPGRRGGWLVRFGSTEEFEVLADGRCAKAP
jgi:hypothetical protein